MNEIRPKRQLFPLADGKFLEVYQNKIDSALPYIIQRVKYSLPIDTVDVEELKKVVSFIRVNVNRDCTAEEVNGLVESIKWLMIDAIDNMKHYEVYPNKGGRDDTTRT